MTTFELRTFSTDSKFDGCLGALLSNANSWKNPSCMTDFICTESQRAQTNQFCFLRFNFITQTTVIECAT